MTTPVSGSLNAVGQGGAVVILLDVPAMLGLLLEVSGNYQGVQLVCEHLLKGGGWRGAADVTQINRYDRLTGPLAVAPLVLPDGGQRAFRFEIPGRSAFRVWASSLTAGVINVTLSQQPWPTPLPAYAP